MRVMVLVKAAEESEAGVMPTTQMLEAMGNFNRELAEAGILQAGGGLKPSSQGRRLAFDGAGRTVSRGPFAAVTELVAGFWIWQVRDMDEAVAWAMRCPNPMPGPGEVESRPRYEMEEFGAEMTPEQRQQEVRLRDERSGG